jgi:hypothetical protein
MEDPLYSGALEKIVAFSLNLYGFDGVYSDF